MSDKDKSIAENIAKARDLLRRAAEELEMLEAQTEELRSTLWSVDNLLSRSESDQDEERTEDESQD